MLKRMLLVAGISLLLLVGGLAWMKFMRPYEFHGSVLQTPKLESGVVLRSAAGPVRLSDYAGNVVLLYFGYTSCPDVCPTSLAKLKEALSQLSPEEAAQVQVIFISVDPQRDTLEKLEQYAHVFGSDFIGASGTRSEIDLLAQSLGVYYKLNTPDADGNYTVDHSSYRAAWLWSGVTIPSRMNSAPTCATSLSMGSPSARKFLPVPRRRLCCTA